MNRFSSRFVSRWLKSAAWAVAAATWLLAGAPALATSLAEPKPPEKPLAATIQVEKSKPALTGTITKWNRVTFTFRPKEGEEREVNWRDILPRLANDYRRKLMETKDPYEWLDLGALLMAMNAGSMAEQAFEQAMKLDEKNCRPFVMTCRAAKSRGADPQQALYSALEEADQLQEKNAKDSGAGKPGRNEKQDERGRKGVVPEPTGGPDDSQSVRGIEPWPATSAEERAKGISQMKDQIEEVCQKSGTRLRTTENDHFILYSVLGDGDTRRILALLDSTYATMGQILGFQPNENIFFGKCFVFVFSERFSFLKFENDFFHYPGAEKAGGVCHHVGPYAMLCFYRAPDEQYFLWTLTHEATHAVMYRYKTPAHLPAWANEGLANFIAGQLCTNANQGSEDFQHAHQFAVQNKDPMKVVRQSYENGTWFDDDSYPLSHMMVRYLVRRDQKAFKNWIDDIKAGKAWEVAMLSRFGQPVGKLMEDFSQEMKFEKTYTKITLQAR